MSVVNFRWPIDLAVTVASHGWVQLAPWRWDPEVLARVPIGLAVKTGAPRPDVSSVEAFKHTLIDAKSIAYIDPASGATSGIHLAQDLEKLGIAAELKPKIRLVSPPAKARRESVRRSKSATLKSACSRSAT